MTQEEIQLLLKTLCAMLPHGVQAQVRGHVNPMQILSITKLHKGNWAWKKGSWVVSFWNDTCSIETIKPYLRPMSNMTNEEWVEYENMCDSFRGEEFHELIDWLNSKHFDYRGLIEKGLALKAPENMYEAK